MSCEHCTKGYIMEGEPKGSMVDDAYLHEGSNKSRAVVLLTDIFGLPLINSKLIADEISTKLDCDVWVPHLFDGEPPFKVADIEPYNFPDRAGEKIPFMTYIKVLPLFLSRIFKLLKIRATVLDPRVNTFIAKIKAEKNYEKIGAVGYCMGGAAAIRLGSKDLVDSLVVAHPGNCTLQEIQAIKIPTAFVCAEEDQMFTPDLRNKSEAVFAARKDKPEYIDYEFVDYKGVVHGFACRPNLGIQDILDAYNKALTQTIAWFAKTL